MFIAGIDGGAYSGAAGGSVGVGAEAWNHQGRLAIYGSLAGHPDSSEPQAGSALGYLAEFEADRYVSSRSTARPLSGRESAGLKLPDADCDCDRNIFIRSRLAGGPLSGDGNWMAEASAGIGVAQTMAIHEYGQHGRTDRVSFSFHLEVAASRLAFDDRNENIYGVRIGITVPLIAPMKYDDKYR